MNPRASRTAASLALLLSAAGCDACTTTTKGAATHASDSKVVTPIDAVPLPADTGRRQAPGFEGATAWLNVDHAVSLAELRGKVVVIDFWTSCCINCIQTLPTLHAIEKRFENDPVAVVGVHSPKFDAETERERLRAAVQEYSIEHPVAIDGSMTVWNKWDVQGWPTLFVLDSRGRVVWTDSGEPDPKQLAGIIASALAEGERDGTLNRAKLAGWKPEPMSTDPLAFPGKVAPLADGSIAIADTAHHRVVLVGKDGKTADVIGSGQAGSVDGDYGEASFRKPQGLAEAGDILYVADTENHEIRAIDRKTKRVTTVAGTGELGHAPLRGGPVPARTAALRSPWDIAFVQGTLYIALAGSHQIAAFDPKGATISTFAGDGSERRKDGRGLAASFAQPSGLASDGRSLFVADSETSSVRAVDLATTEVTTLVGDDLFVFGDVDGVGKTVRLKHPIGIAWGEGALWIADTYNSKIKRLDPRTGKTETFAGGASRAELFEPAGLFVRAGEVVVADTHHDRLVAFPLKGGPARPFSPEGLAAPVGGVSVAQAAEAAPDQRIDLGTVAVAAEGASTLHIRWTLPRGTGVNEEAPFRVRWASAEGLVRAPDPIRGVGAQHRTGFDVSVTPSPLAAPKLVANVDMVLCDIETHRVCKSVRRAYSLALRPAGRATDTTIAVALPEAK